ncbi:MAG: hypothetical protein GX601_18655, partial [Anaerolineales bacterium]|nr:hypothetical protein [Anaerolineales bacterium]
MAVIVAFGGLSTSGCGTSRALEKIAVAIESALSELPEMSGDWIELVNETRDELVEVGYDIVANELSRLVAVAVARTGANVRCEIDFVAARAQSTLSAALAAVRSKEDAMPKSAPMLCDWDTQVIDLTRPPAQRMRLELFGYDLDHLDPDGKPVQVFLAHTLSRQEQLRREPIRPGDIILDPSDPDIWKDLLRQLDTSTAGPRSDETWESMTDQYDMTTHYSAVIDISSGSGIPVEDTDADRVVLTWGELQLASVPILRLREPEERIEVVAPGRSFTHTPTKVLEGDADFDGKVDILAKALVIVDPEDHSRLVLQLYMKAKEPKSDWTCAESTNDTDGPEYELYRAPEGFEIVEVISPRPAMDRIEFRDTDWD